MMDHYAYITVKLDRSSPSPGASPNLDNRELNGSLNSVDNASSDNTHLPTTAAVAASGSHHGVGGSFNGSNTSPLEQARAMHGEPVTAAGGGGDTSRAAEQIDEQAGTKAGSNGGERRASVKDEGGGGQGVLPAFHRHVTTLVTPAPSPGLWPSSPFG